MSVELTQPTNGSTNVLSPTRPGLRHRKRSSSLFALAELRIPSPPPSPSVSIDFPKDYEETGDIPIIFDFLTTGSMPSEERISKMASLKPVLPPLVKFSPMSAFFPMSDSSGTLNTISTEAFGMKRRGSNYSESNQYRYSTISDYFGVYSSSSGDFNISSPTEAVSHEAQCDIQDSMASSLSMPAVHVLDYDVGQKKLGDMSNFTVSAFLTSSSMYGNSIRPLESGGTEGNIAGNREDAQDESTIKPFASENEIVLPIGRLGNDLLSTPSPLDLDDKTPTQSMFFRPRVQEQTMAQRHLSGAGVEGNQTDMAAAPMTTDNSCLTAPPSPDYDDKTPTQATFLKRETQVRVVAQPCPPRTGDEMVCGSTVTAAATDSLTEEDVSAGRAASLNVLFSPTSDDKTPTQTTFLKRQSGVESLPSAPPSLIVRAETPDAPSLHIPSGLDLEEQILHHQLFKEKALPAPPKAVVDKPLGTAEDDKSTSDDLTVSFNAIPQNTLPVPCLRHAQWLRDTVVELWIDQEGFRAIRPKFFLASVSSGLPYPHEQYGTPPGIMELSEEHDPLYTTVAEFLPVSRAAHYFHHAAFDRGPTLHRITTGDETKDYITRAATISLRDNGVFFIHGTEDHRIGTDILGGGGRIVRLNWRFEYFVSSRRPDGRSAHRGEKVITPLSFSCTPALLHRKHAHKVTVLHIMKKTLLPKLLAQKLEPPDLPMLQTRLSASSLASSFMTGTIPMSESRGSVVSHMNRKSTPSPSKGGMRDRRGSESNSGTGSVAGAMQPFAPPRLMPPPRPPFLYTKHRRGSHSDTTPEDYMRQRNDSVSHAAHERSRSASSVGCVVRSGPGSHEQGPSRCNAHLIGPIIPQHELIRMLDSQSHSRPVLDDDRRPHSIRVEVVNNVQMTTLPAAPRHKHNP